MNYAVMDMFINTMQFCDHGYSYQQGYPHSLDMFMDIMHTSIPEHSYQLMTYTLS